MGREQFRMEQGAPHEPPVGSRRGNEADTRMIQALPPPHVGGYGSGVQSANLGCGNSLPGRKRCSSFGDRGRLARSFRRPAENIRAAHEHTIWCALARTGTSRRDADWGDRDGRDPLPTESFRLRERAGVRGNAAFAPFALQRSMFNVQRSMFDVDPVRPLERFQENCSRRSNEADSVGVAYLSPPPHFGGYDKT